MGKTHTERAGHSALVGFSHFFLGVGTIHSAEKVAHAGQHSPTLTMSPKERNWPFEIPLSTYYCAIHTDGFKHLLNARWQLRAFANALKKHRTPSYQRHAMLTHSDHELPFIWGHVKCIYLFITCVASRKTPKHQGAK